MLASFLLIQNLWAQTGDWDAVAATPAGTHIYVVSRHLRRACTLLRVTGHELLCEEDHTPFGGRTRVAPRQEVREVREVQAREAKTLIGGVVGAAAGIAVGLATTTRSKDPETRVYGPVFGALIGIIAGSLAGNITSEVHSRTIYKR